MHFRFAACACLLLAIACGGTTVVDPAGGGSGGTASTSGTGAGTSTSGTGANGGSGAGIVLDCTELEQAYLDTLEAARSCAPNADFEECTLIVDDQIPCPCGGVAVNPENADAVSRLDELRSDWEAQSCGSDIACPDILCEPASGGVCLPGPNGMDGLCETVF
jgi:hypothetical protein